MSRTSGISGHSRRSRRLLESGYYQIPSDLDAVTSEDDDTASLDSNVIRSSLSEQQRLVKYGETSPTVKFNNRRRRNPSGSPIRQPRASTSENPTVNRSVLIKKQVTHRTGVTKLLASSSHAAHSSHHPPSVFSAASAPVVAGSRRGYASDLGGAHGSTAPHQFAMGESGGQHHQTNENVAAATSYYEGDSSMQMKSTATTDAAFKLPSGTTMHRRRKSYESQSGAQNGENFETSFSDEDDDSSNNGRIEHRSTVRNDVFLFKIFVLFYQVFRSCGAVIAGTVWSMGRFLYQSVTQVLLLDTWVLTRVKPASPFFQAASKFLRWLLIILGILCASILLYSSYPDREKVHIQSTIHQKTYWDMIWSFSKPGAFFDSVQDGKWPDSASSSGSSAMNEASLKRAMEDLQLAIGELEVRVADRHSSILDKVQLMHASQVKDMESMKESDKKVLKSVENIVENSVARQLIDVSTGFDVKLLKLQEQIHSLELNHSKSMVKLKTLIAEKGITLSEETKDVLAQVKQSAASMAALDERVEQLKQEHRLFRSSVESKSGNDSYIREISDDRFVENFLQLLQSSPKSSKSTNRRYQHLAAVFVQWLQLRGFVDEQSVVVLQNNIARNVSNLAVELSAQLEKKIQSYRKEQASRSTITLDTIIPKHPHTKTSTGGITEALVKAWIGESLEIYSADRIGMADFALESSGGYIVSTRCSKSFQRKTALVSIFGIPIYYNINTPRSVIQPNVMPGDCWAFQGSEGYIVIGLSAAVQPDSFTLEHIPQSIALYKNISSAPKDFSVYGLQSSSDVDGEHLGSYRYNKELSSIQNFKAEPKKSDQIFRFIELRIASNWGNPHFTCVYRFRVHGTKVEDSSD